ncbi:MAG: tRNA lysidine(34) synthetase TilS [Treponema sp.]|jgi:tRNA(Ile)-lysidine synthase|nr:tRNA lysidine(34) synthetase TilS [Treponema sp.]
MMNPFEVSVAAALGDCSRGRVFLAAVSGGADSTAMLCALAALKREQGFILHCLHVDHGIRPAVESRGDGEFVAELCKKLEIPCRIFSIPPGKIAAGAKKQGMGLEAAARYYRRRAWNREARRIGAQAILVAHTRDDLLETVLMRVFRGSGPAGLAAMPVRRGRILRPLLEFSRAGVLRYLEEKNIPYRTDSTNADNRFLRNAIRNRLVPLLADLFPHWQGCVLKLAETQRLTADFLAGEARRRVHWEERAGELHTGAADFFSLPPILREEALFQGADRLFGGVPGNGRGGAKNPLPVKRSNIRKFSRGDTAALDLGCCRVRKTFREVILAPAAPAPREAGFTLLIKAPGSYKLKGAFLEVLPALSAGHTETAGRDFYAALPLALRKISPGDTLVQRGRKIVPGDLKAPPGADVFCAVDLFGTAAFIAVEGGGAFALSGRERPQTAAEAGPVPENRRAAEWNGAGLAGGVFYYVVLHNYCG